MKFHSTATRLLLALALLTLSASAQNTPTSPNQYVCDVATTLARNRGDPTFICFHLAPIGIKVVLAARIDEAAIFRIDGAYSLLSTKTTPINIIAQIQATRNYS
jgi:hypothetical protein